MKVKIGRYRKNDKKRKIKIELDKFDTWSMDHTLALIIHPMLIQLKETKHGSPHVANEDLPPHMRYSETPEYSDQLVFDFYRDKKINKQNVKCDVHDQWDWALDEMIWTFEQLVKDDDSQFYDHSACNKKDGVMEQIKSIKVDTEGLDQYHARIGNGLRLFGRYYRNLWD